MELEQASNIMTSRPAQPIGKSQLYALLVDAAGNPALDGNGNKQVAALQTVNGKLQVEGSITGSLVTTISAPVTGVKTVTATAAEVFAGASAKSGRRRMIVKNESQSLRFRLGGASINQQTGFPIEPGAIVKINFDPNIVLPIFAVSEGASLQVTVWED